MSLFDYPALWQCLDDLGLANWRAALEPVVQGRLRDEAHGDFARWRDILEKLNAEPADTAVTRELLLAQSSDWSFLMRNEPSRGYAESRARKHLDNFDRVWDVTTKPDDVGILDEIEPENPIFPDLPWNMFEPYGQG